MHGLEKLGLYSKDRLAYSARMLNVEALSFVKLARRAHLCTRLQTDAPNPAGMPTRKERFYRIDVL